MSPLRPRYGAGVFASLTAEAVFVAMVAGVSSVRGLDPWRVVRMPGSLLLGPAAVDPPGYVAGDVVMGILLHVWLGILVGLIYAGLLPLLGLSPVKGGLIAGAVLYALGFWALPILFSHWLSPFWLPPTEKLLQAVAHSVYGVVFGVVFERVR